MMLSEEDKGFLVYWEQNRLRKKKIWRQLSVGLPLAVSLVGAIFINVYSGWNPAASALRINPARFLIVLIAILLIVIFIVIFSARHRWDMNEQRFKELLGKKDRL